MDLPDYLKKEIFSDSSSAFILVTNIILLTCALAMRWSIYEVILAFIVQNLIVGFFYLIRILNTGRNMFEYMTFSATHLKKLKTISIVFALSIIFLLLFGMSNWIYMIFIIRNINVLSWALFLIPAVIFVIPHLILYREKIKMQREEYQFRDIFRFMWIAYARIIPMHAVLLLAILIGDSWIIVIIFTILKTAVDFKMNKVERKLNKIKQIEHVLQKPKNKHEEWMVFDGKIVK